MSLSPLLTVGALFLAYRFYITADMVWLAAAGALIMLVFLVGRNIRAAAVIGFVSVAIFASEPGGREQVEAALKGEFGALAFGLCFLLLMIFALRLMMHTSSVSSAERDVTKPFGGRK